MSVLVNKSVSLLGSLPRVVRFVLWPVLWRGGVIIGIFALLRKFPDLVPYDLEKGGSVLDLSPMFYSISGVLGVLAGFLVAALTILGTVNLPSAEMMRRRAATSMPLKLLYSIATLLVASIAVSLSGPYADHFLSFTALFGGLAVAGLEMIAVSFLVFMALVPQGSSSSKVPYDIDP